MGRGKKTSTAQLAAGSVHCSGAFWVLRAFYLVSKKGETTARVLFFLRPGRRLCVSTAWTAQLLRKGENLSKKTVTPDVLSVYRLLLGLSACRCPGELPLFFLLSNLLYSITTHCFYYGFCADDTPLFSKRCGPPPSHDYCCFSTTGCTPQWCENLFFFFPLVLVDILVNENHPQLASLVWQF